MPTTKDHLAPYANLGVDPAWDRQREENILAHLRRVEVDLSRIEKDQPEAHRSSAAGVKRAAAKIGGWRQQKRLGEEKLQALLPRVKEFAERGLYRYQMCRLLRVHHRVIARALEILAKGELT